MDQLYREIVQLLERGERAALATVVRATGSTPGKESAKMLIREDGTSVGSIGGGCTEADVWALARDVIDRDRPRLERFTLTPKVAEEEGLACGGIVEIFIEPIGRPTVHVFGAGHIGREVIALAHRAGFSTVIIDDREQFACRESFPDADRIVVDDLEGVFDSLPIGESSYLVIVTRGHRSDQKVLARAVRTSAGYIGLIGSRAKIGKIFRQLVDEGAPTDALERVRAPVGLDIGARTPEEIAVSIVAQLIAVRRRAFLKNPDRDGGFDRIPVPAPRNRDTSGTREPGDPATSGPA